MWEVASLANSTCLQRLFHLPQRGIPGDPRIARFRRGDHWVKLCIGLDIVGHSINNAMTTTITNTTTTNTTATFTSNPSHPYPTPCTSHPNNPPHPHQTNPQTSPINRSGEFAGRPLHHTPQEISLLCEGHFCHGVSRVIVKSHCAVSGEGRVLNTAFSWLQRSR